MLQFQINVIVVLIIFSLYLSFSCYFKYLREKREIEVKLIYLEGCAKFLGVAGFLGIGLLFLVS